jgi:HEAT repeat protein
MVAADFSDYLKFILTDPRYSGTSSFYTTTDALLTLEAEIVKQEELPTEGAERTPVKVERLPVLEMLRKYGLGEKRVHLLLAGKPGSGKSTTLRRMCVELAEIALGDELQPIPVFVQLKGDKPLLTIIQAEFRRAKLKVTEEQIDDLLLADQLVLLLDGVNEIPSEQLRRELQEFRENNLTTPTIFTTRDLTVGGSLGIDKRLEMRSLTNEQMRKFVHKYLPEYGDKLLGQLRDRLREIAETPLLLKMLCEVFDPKTGQIPQNKGELFELFDRKYQRHKEGVAVSDDFRRFQSEVLQYLGFTMLQGDAQKPTEAWLTLPRQRAEGLLEDWLKQRGEANPASKAKEWLEDLVEHHLLQVAADPQQIEFHHQLFQEYYAARHLKSMLQSQHPDVLVDERLKHFYLNCLKWTEPLGLLLGLLDDEVQALRLVRLGLEVDWFMGARLAGEVRQGFQPQTVGLVNRLIEDKDLPQWLRLKLWETTRSSAIVPELLPLLQHPKSNIRWRVIEMIIKLGDRNYLPELLPLLQDLDTIVQSSVVKAIEQLGDRIHLPNLLSLLKHPNSIVRSNVVEAIEQLGDRIHLPNLLSLLKHPNSIVRSNVVEAIEQLGDRIHLPDLLPLLQHPNSIVRSSVVKAIVKVGDNNHLPDLLLLLQDPSFDVRSSVAKAIITLGNKNHLPELLTFLKHPDSNVRSNVVEVIIKVGDKNHLPNLLPLLQDPDFHVRSSVVKAIFKLGDRSHVPDLLPLLQHHNSNIRSSVVEVIVKVGDKNHLPDLLPLLQDLNSSVRSSVVKAIVKVGDKNHLPDLLPLLQHHNSNIRSSVVEVIVKVGDKNHLPDLLPLLRDPDSSVRSSVVKAIVNVGDRNHLPDLLPLLQDPDFDIRSSVIKAIVNVGDRNHLPDLLPLLQHHNSNIRSSVVEAIVTLGDSNHLPDLLPLLQHPDSIFRYVVVEVIVKVGDRRHLPDLLLLLQDPDFNVRSSVVKAIVTLGNRSHLPDSLPLLQHPNSVFRYMVVKSIVKVGYRNHLPDLLLLLQNPDSDVRSSVVEAIVEVGDRSHLPDLLLLLQDPNSNVRSNVVEAIWQLGGENAVVILTDVLNFRGANMREIAAKGLGEIREWQEVSLLTRSLAIIALLNSLTTHHEPVRIAAAGSLSKIGNFKILPHLHQKLIESKDDKVAKIFFAIQAKCEFYNYDIFRIPPTNQQSFPPSLTVNINKLGNLNTGTVNVQGNQIGIQQTVDPQ